MNFSGGVVGTSAAMMTVSEAGAVAGLSASGITSGLTVIGGSAGMVGGLAVCASVATGGVIVVGGLAWLVTNRIRQRKSEVQYGQFLQNWRAQGYTGPQ